MFSITEAILKAHQADSLEKETPDASMTRNEDGCCSPVPSDLQFVEIALTESLGHYSSLSEIDLTCETELYKQCQSMTVTRMIPFEFTLRMSMNCVMQLLHFMEDYSSLSTDSQRLTKTF